jgi:protoporphyrinogen oxidase
VTALRIQSGDLPALTVPPPAQSSASSVGRVGVIGGGIAGLATAYYLRQAGAEVELFESTPSFGGLGSSFRHGAYSLDRFYHVILPTDNCLLELCESLGIRERVYWKEASLGFLYGRRLYGLRGPLDLLRFGALPIPDRFRLGLTALYTGYVASSAGLDDVTAVEWLTRLSGRRAGQRLWRPLLEAKFGDGYDRIPALWYWTSFNREKGTKKEVKGYLQGGYTGLTDTIVESLVARGVSLHPSTPISALDLDSAGRPRMVTASGTVEFDRIVSTIPLAHLSRIVSGGALEGRLRPFVDAIDYQGVINVLVLLRRSLTPYYWVPAVECGVPFHGIVETTRVIDLEQTGGYHLVYLMNYVHRTHPLFHRDPDALAAEYVDALLGLFPELERQDVCGTFVFKAPYVEPLYTPGYGRRKPPGELVPGRVYLATTAQVYPSVTSWNSSIGLAKSVLERMLERVLKR